jgi:hypothetical protein
MSVGACQGFLPDLSEAWPHGAGAGLAEWSTHGIGHLVAGPAAAQKALRNSLTLPEPGYPG